MLKEQAQHTLSETHKITLTFPNTLAPAADMKAGVSLMSRHGLYDSMPIGMLQQIGAILDRYPQIELDNLAWRLDTIEIPHTFDDIPAQFIIKGRLADFENDYRAALAYLENFRRDMAAEAYQVEVLNQPFDVSPGGSIADQREIKTNALVFSLKISKRRTS